MGEWNHSCVLYYVLCERILTHLMRISNCVPQRGIERMQNELLGY